MQVILFLLHVGFVTLNDVLDNDNESLLDAKVGELYLYDDANADYGKIRLNDSIFRLIGSNGSDVLYAEGPLLTVGNMNLLGDNLTVSRFFTLPNKDGTIALTNDLVTPDLQIVTDEGSVTTNPVEVGELRLGDTSTSNYSTIYAFGNATFFKGDTGNLIREIYDGGEGRFTLGGDILNVSWSSVTGTKNRQEPNKSGTYAMTNDLPQIADNFANDAAAAIGGIAVGGLYHTAGTVKIRLV